MFHTQSRDSQVTKLLRKKENSKLLFTETESSEFILITILPSRRRKVIKLIWLNFLNGMQLLRKLELKVFKNYTKKSLMKSERTQTEKSNRPRRKFQLNMMKKIKISLKLQKANIWDQERSPEPKRRKT